MATATPRHNWSTGENGTETLLDSLGGQVILRDNTSGDLNSTGSDVVALSGSVNVDASRLIRIDCCITSEISAVDAEFLGFITMDGDNYQSARWTAHSTSEQLTLTPWTILAPGAAGTHSFTFHFRRNSGTGLVYVLDDSKMIVTDVGHQ